MNLMKKAILQTMGFYTTVLTVSRQLFSQDRVPCQQT